MGGYTSITRSRTLNAAEIVNTALITPVNTLNASSTRYFLDLEPRALLLILFP